MRKLLRVSALGAAAWGVLASLPEARAQRFSLSLDALGLSVGQTPSAPPADKPAPVSTPRRNGLDVLADSLDRSDQVEYVVLAQDLPHASASFRQALDAANKRRMGTQNIDALLEANPGAWAIVRDMWERDREGRATRPRPHAQRGSAPMIVLFNSGTQKAPRLMTLAIPQGYEPQYDEANSQLTARRQHTVQEDGRDQRVLDVYRYRTDGGASFTRFYLGAEGSAMTRAAFSGSQALERDVLARTELSGIRDALGRERLQALRAFLDADVRAPKPQVRLSLSEGRVTFSFWRGRERLGTVRLERNADAYDVIGSVPSPPRDEGER